MNNGSADFNNLIVTDKIRLQTLQIGNNNPQDEIIPSGPAVLAPNLPNTTGDLPTSDFSHQLTASDVVNGFIRIASPPTTLANTVTLYCPAISDIIEHLGSPGIGTWPWDATPSSSAEQNSKISYTRSSQVCRGKSVPQDGDILTFMIENLSPNTTLYINPLLQTSITPSLATSPAPAALTPTGQNTVQSGSMLGSDLLRGLSDDGNIGGNFTQAIQLNTIAPLSMGMFGIIFIDGGKSSVGYPTLYNPDGSFATTGTTEWHSSWENSNTLGSKSNNRYWTKNQNPTPTTSVIEKNTTGWPYSTLIRMA